jgi:hypothetical protein
MGLADSLAGAAPAACRPVVGVNHKPIRRLWREEGLRRPVRTRKRRRVAPEQTERLRGLEGPPNYRQLPLAFQWSADLARACGGCQFR